jgi:CMP-N-acetylneuraminic acid synthetase
MYTLAVILARAGSKGLPDKCLRPLCGSPVLAYTIGHAQASECVDAVVLSTDSDEAAELGRAAGLRVIDRPAELATDATPVAASTRHAVETFEKQTGQRCDVVVILYGNVPIRSDGIVDRCVKHLTRTGCDSVRTVAPVTKQHPDWIHRLDNDRMIQFRPNHIHRRQDLEPLYYHDGAVVVVRRAGLFKSQHAHDPHAFFGDDRRAVVQGQEDTVDIDSLADLFQAEALIRLQGETATPVVSAAETNRSLCTPALAQADSHG